MRILVGALLMSVMCITHSAAASSRKDQNPLWTADLRKEGYVVDRFSPPGAYQANRQITFGSTHELLVTNDPHSDPLTVGAVTGFMLDTSSGRVVNKASWQAKGYPYVFATDSGQYVINTASGLVLYSAGLREQEVTVAASAIFASPDGTSFASKKAIPGPHGVTYFLDAHTLKQNGIEYLDQNVDTIARDRIAYSAIINSTHAVVIRGPSGTVMNHLTSCSEPRGTFISFDVLAVSGCDRVEVVDPIAGLRFRIGTEAYETSVVGVSRDGSRFTIREAFYGRGHDPGLKYERFTVVDIASRSPVLVVRVNELRGRKNGASAAALAPDGALLAIDSQGVVQAYEIRGPEAQQ